MSLDNVQSTSEYMVLTPGVILSEHSTIAQARRARSAAVTEGFQEVVIVKRTERGWQTHSGKSHS